jgi:hypothetical protein
MEKGRVKSLSSMKIWHCKIKCFLANLNKIPTHLIIVHNSNDSHIGEMVLHLEDIGTTEMEHGHRLRHGRAANVGY